MTRSVLLARAREAPVRADILEILSIDGLRALSAPEVAFELQASTRAVSYHLQILELLGLVEISEERVAVDAYERRFCLVSRVRRLD